MNNHKKAIAAQLISAGHKDLAEDLITAYTKERTGPSGPITSAVDSKLVAEVRKILSGSFYFLKSDQLESAVMLLVNTAMKKILSKQDIAHLLVDEFPNRLDYAHMKAYDSSLDRLTFYLLKIHKGEK